MFDGSKLSQLIAQHGLTQANLAKCEGMPTQGMISSHCSGRKQPSEKTIAVYASFFNVDAGYFKVSPTDSFPAIATIPEFVARFMVGGSVAEVQSWCGDEQALLRKGIEYWITPANNGEKIWIVLETARKRLESFSIECD